MIVRSDSKGGLPPQAEPVVDVRRLTVCYDGKPALWEAGLAVPRGTLTGVIGPNGAGKSTLLKALLGLVPAATGSIELFGKPLKEVRRRIAYVPQRESVDWDYPISARDVVAMGLYGRVGFGRWIGRREKREAEAALARVGMDELADRRIGSLSGGQQQRVFLARALAQGADLYLMDEPFAGIDATTEAVIVDQMRRLRAGGATVVCVHHDLASARSYFDHAVVLNLRVVACGPASEVLGHDVLAECYGDAVGWMIDPGRLEDPHLGCPYGGTQPL
ncbi:MAG: ABC transporter ATP-binding protein [Planctomycetota bacterium]